MEHFHDFKSWTFKESVNTGVFTTRQILEGTHPVLDVYHSADGDWQFLCGTTQEIDDLKLVCFGCMIERDSSLLELADLPLSWCAFRVAEDGTWTREEYEESQDET